MFTKNWTDEEVEHALGLRKLGFTARQIGLKIGRTELAVSSKFTELSPSSASPKTRWVNDKVIAAQAERLNAYDRRDLTATVCGDPPPGYSALDRMRNGATGG